MKFTFANFARARGEAWTSVELSWDQLCHVFRDHVEFRAKDDYWAFAPIELKKSPGLRNTLNTLQTWAWVGDFDDISEEQAAHIVKETEPFARIIYTTYGHFNGIRKKDNQPKGARFRVILPYARPVLPADHKRIYFAGANWLGNVSDEQCADVPHFHYGPSHAPSAKFSPVFFGQGKFLDPSFLKGKPVTRASLMTVAQRWRRREDPTLGIALASVMKGDPYADFGERDIICYSLCKELVSTFPDASPAQLASYFGISSAQMGTDAPDVLKKLETLYQTKSEIPDIRKKHIRDYFEAHGEPGRDDAWIADELEVIQQQGPWIINAGTSYYFLTRDGYSRPYIPEEAKNSVHQHLAPSDVPLQVDDKWIPLASLVHTHGRSVERLVYDMTAAKSSFDIRLNTFSEATCPLRPLPAQYSHAVNEWLVRAFGSNIELINKWLALLPEIDKACVALLITGHPGAGKTLFAHACARLWTLYTPSSLVAVLGSFNASLAACPLVVADEMIPENAQGRPKTRELRELIGTTQRVLSKKYQLESSLVGAVRVVIMANSEDILQISESLTQDDAAAITERILHLPIDASAKSYLESLGQDRVAMFVHNDEVASHALWLHQNYKFEREGRFQIRPKDSRLLERLSVGSGVRSLVCRWCVQFLSLYQSNPTALVRSAALIKDGQLYINSGDIIRPENWTIFMGVSYPPKIEDVSRAIRGLVCGEYRAGGNKRYFRVNLEYLRTWAELVGHDLDFLQISENNDPRRASN